MISIVKMEILFKKKKKKSLNSISKFQEINQWSFLLIDYATFFHFQSMIFLFILFIETK